MIKRTKGEKIFAVFNTALLLMLLAATLYPCLYVVVQSISDPYKMVGTNKLSLIPKGISFENYIRVFKNSMIWTGYLNTVFYSVVGTLLSLLLTIMLAFALIKKGLKGKNFILIAITFTMYFGGGLIPTYMVVKYLGLIDTRLAMILPNAINTYNFIIMLSFFRSMPDSLLEAAEIDGARDFIVLFRIVVPLAKPVVMVVALYYMVGLWNDYFTAMIYLNSSRLYPLQIVLRDILFQNNTVNSASAQVDNAESVLENMKYATIVVATIPLLCIYPYLQKFFVKGVMIGAVKG